MAVPFYSGDGLVVEPNGGVRGGDRFVPSKT
jgi:hypothetical protein